MPVSAYQSPADYTVDAWEFIVNVDYKVTYDINSGKISSVTLLGTELGDAIFSPDARGRVTSLNYESCKLSIVNNGYAIKCAYSATATFIYTKFPGVPFVQETINQSVSGTATVAPSMD